MSGLFKPTSISPNIALSENEATQPITAPACRRTTAIRGEIGRSIHEGARDKARAIAKTEAYADREKICQARRRERSVGFARHRNDAGGWMNLGDGG